MGNQLGKRVKTTWKVKGRLVDFEEGLRAAWRVVNLKLSCGELGELLKRELEPNNNKNQTQKWKTRLQKHHGTHHALDCRNIRCHNLKNISFLLYHSSKAFSSQVSR
jgi:hypothetical protein